jgi:hypothetical protein
MWKNGGNYRTCRKCANFGASKQNCTASNKLLLPDPFRPTTVLVADENGCISACCLKDRKLLIVICFICIFSLIFFNCMFNYFDLNATFITINDIEVFVLYPPSLLTRYDKNTKSCSKKKTRAHGGANPAVHWRACILRIN